MPSDPTGIQPKGTLVRPAPDYFDDNLGCGGHYFFDPTPPAGNTWMQFALFNNDNSGRALKVYGVSAFSEGGGGFLMSYVKGAVGSFQVDCSAVRPDLGAPPGQIFFNVSEGNASPVPLFIPANIIGAVPCAGFDSNAYFAPFPMYIVPAGYSLVGTNPSSTLEGYMTFWYQVANE